MEMKRCYGCMRMKLHTPVCEHCGYEERQRNSQMHLPLGTVLNGQWLIGRVLDSDILGFTYIAWHLEHERIFAIREYFPVSIAARNPADKVTVVLIENKNQPLYVKYYNLFLQQIQFRMKYSWIGCIPATYGGTFTANNTLYMIMEYMEGTTLKDRVSKMPTPLTPDETWELLKPLAAAISELHDNHLLYRDLTPGNVLILWNGQVRLQDGATLQYPIRYHGEEFIPKIVNNGFSPIEEYMRNGKIGPWTDVYGFCAIAYYCLTGKVPPLIPDRMMDGPELPLLDRVPGLKRNQWKGLQQGLAIRPGDRIQDMKTLCAMLWENSMDL
ncbi:MAG: protein kinase [Oscillospiraceae bacterium]|nr:protein kinase [Oscillospiraceae bacterium]